MVRSVHCTLRVKISKELVPGLVEWGQSGCSVMFGVSPTHCNFAVTSYDFEGVLLVLFRAKTVVALGVDQLVSMCQNCFFFVFFFFWQNHSFHRCVSFLMVHIWITPWAKKNCELESLNLNLDLGVPRKGKSLLATGPPVLPLCLGTFVNRALTTRLHPSINPVYIGLPSS